MNYIDTIIEALGLLGIIWGLYYTSKQIKLSYKINNESLNWNRKVFTEERIEKKPDQTIINELDIIFSTKNSMKTIPTQKVLNEIEKNPIIHDYIAYKLNRFERLARGIRQKTIDEDLVKESLSNYIIQAYFNYKDYIDYHNHTSIRSGLENFQWLVENWYHNKEFKEIFQMAHEQNLSDSEKDMN